MTIFYRVQAAVRTLLSTNKTFTDIYYGVHYDNVSYIILYMA